MRRTPFVVALWSLVTLLAQGCGGSGTGSGTSASATGGDTTFLISGMVTTGSGAGIGGVEISGNGLTRTTTATDGTYSVTAPNGSYVLTPALSGYAFVPSTLTVTVSNGPAADRNFTATPTTGPVDCVVSAWGPWSSCSGPCGGMGTQSRTRSILVPSANGGMACPALTESQSCAPACSPTLVTMQARFTDACTDGYWLEYRWFDTTANLVWPDATHVYYTEYDNTPYTSVLSCTPGHLICGGAAFNAGNNPYWGIGLDGDRACTNCCVKCAAGAVLVFTAICR